MIYIDVGGRCGNQLFQYAFAKALDCHYNSGITFNFWRIYYRHKSDVSWNNDLAQFSLVKTYEDSLHKYSILHHGNILQILAYIIYRVICLIPYRSRPDFYHRQEVLQPIINRFGIYSMVHGYSEIVHTRFKNQFVEGTCEDRRYFDSKRSELQKEIQPKEELGPEIVHMLKLIDETNSVCVSIRRGDFTASEQKSLRDICTPQYYEKAFEKVSELIDKPVYFFFSDDINWVKDNIHVANDSYYESGNDSIAVKLLLMSRCKHFIMSNSTFCWWAQYLSIYENGIRISPDRWFNMPGYKHQLIGDDWILIEC